MERLKQVLVSKEDDLVVYRHPNLEEIADKVNEIVDWINKNEKNISKLDFEFRFGKLKNRF